MYAMLWSFKMDDIFQKDILALLDLPYPEQAGYGLTSDQLVLESS